MKRRLPVLGAVVALATVGILVPTATPARAAVPILGDAQAVASIVNQVKSAYTALIEYLTDPAKPPSQLDQIKAAITQSATDIKNEIDATATGEVLSACDDIVIQFEDIDKKTGDVLEAFRNDAVSCVTAAARQIAAQTTPGQIDVDGLALNIGAPIALAASVKADDSTDLLIEAINEGNRALLAKTQLRPACGVTPDVDVLKVLTDALNFIPGTGGDAPIPGHGACYSYRVAAPQPIQGSLLYFPTGPNTGALPWTVTGDGQTDFCTVIFTCGKAHVTWPSTARWDFSVAIDQAMAATSYPIAAAALDKMAALPGPNGPPVSLVAETATNEIYSPIDVFGVTPTGQMVRGVLADTSHDDDDNGDFAHDTFGGWNSFDGPAFVAGVGGPGYTARSVASAVTWDGRVQVFMLDRAGNLFTRWQRNPADDSQWSPWAHLDGTLNSVAVARNANGRLQIFGTTSEHKVVTRYQVLNTEAEAAGKYVPQGSGNIHPALDAWTAWQTMDPFGPTTQVTAVTSSGKISLFAALSYGSLVERHQTAANAAEFKPGNWTAWTSVAGPTIAGAGVGVRSVQAMVDLGGRTNLVVTADGSLQYHRFFGIGGPWVQVPGSMYGGFGLTKEGGGAGADEMFGVDKGGNVFYAFSSGLAQSVSGGWAPATWSPWIPVSGATLRAYEPGPFQGSVLTSVQPSAGQVTLTWLDESTNEDAFAVFRYATGGQLVSEAADLPTGDRAGTDTTVTFTDTSPSASAPCYQVIAYDYNGSFGGPSDIVCRTPGVVGSIQTAATGAITGAGFTVTVATVNDCVNTGTVRAQSPAAGTPAAWSAAVTITVPTCTRTVPNLFGSTQAAATGAITGAGLTLGAVSIVPGCNGAGTVASQRPAAGSAVAPGSTVDITVLACTVTVPNVTGLSQGAATAAITAAGLTVGTVSQASGSPSGSVLAQGPSAGTVVSAGSAVNVTVAASGVQVPNVLGKTQAQATSTLSGAGLVADPKLLKDCSNPGKVVDQSPSVGTFVPSGSTVHITVDTGTVKTCDL